VAFRKYPTKVENRLFMGACVWFDRILMEQRGKYPVELTGYHHKKLFSNILMISSQRHYLVNTADDIDLIVLP
jgi:hypothetical protein